MTERGYVAVRPSGGGLSGKMKRIVLIFGVIIAVLSALFFLAARADWNNLDCRRWPDAGNCSDAVATQWITGSAICVAILMGLIVWRGLR